MGTPTARVKVPFLLLGTPVGRAPPGPFSLGYPGQSASFPSFLAWVSPGVVTEARSSFFFISPPRVRSPWDSSLAQRPARFAPNFLSRFRAAPHIHP